ncbi:hypothetical protein F3K40_45415 [Streptomyces sp. LBUM 1478]|nr:hypothetical protein [Streptomyces sp. LBUM 1478]
MQGRGSAAVVLEALRVRMVDRGVPAADRGIAYSTYEGCGAILVPRHFAVDLDAHRPLARSVPSNDPDRPGPAIDLPYQVSLRKPEILLVSAQTRSCTCDWYLELDWSSGAAPERCASTTTAARSAPPASKDSRSTGTGTRRAGFP